MLHMLTQMISNQLDKANDEELTLIQKMNNVKCTILETGLRPTEMTYYVCSCDPNKIEAICEECAKTCHKNHIISQSPLRGLQVCSCGTKAHYVDDKAYDTYKNQCFYDELAVVSKLNIYYTDNTSGAAICIYCYNMCFEDKRDSYKMNTGLPVPPCQCNHQNHEDVRFIFSVNNKIGDGSKYAFNGLNANMLLNLIFKSTTSFDNTYAQFVSYYGELSFKLKDQEFKIDRKLHLTNFFSSLNNFSTLCNYFSHLRYPCKEVTKYFSTEFLFDLIKKFDDTDQMLTFISPIINIFNKTTISGETSHIPNFKVTELENMSILQRIALMHLKNQNEFIYTHLVNNDNNLIEMFIEKIENLSKYTKLKKTAIYDVLIETLSLLTKLAAMNFFHHDHIFKFCWVLNNCFKNFYHIRKKLQKDENMLKELNLKETRLFKKILKILRIFCYTYNDSIVKAFLLNKEEITIDNVYFLHTKIDIGKQISKLTISIMNIVSKIYSKEDPLFNTYNNLIERGSDILCSLSIDKDPYLISMSRTAFNSDIYLKLITGNLQQNEASVICKLNELAYRLEEAYKNYYNFEINAFDLTAVAKQCIFDYLEDCVNSNINQNNNGDANNKSKNNFSFLNLENNELLEGNLNKSKLLQAEISVNININASSVKRNSTNPENNPDFFRNLLYGSSFLFSAIKVIDILSEPSDELIDFIYRLLWYFVGTNPENAILCLGYNIYKPLTTLPQKYTSTNFSFFFHCFKQLGNHNTQLGNCRSILTNLTKYLLNLDPNYNDKYSCLYYYIKILSLCLINIPHYNHNTLADFVNETVFTIFSKYAYFQAFNEYLLTVTKDVQDGKYNVFNFDDYDENNIAVNFNKGIKFEIKEEREVFMTNSLGYNIFFNFLKLLNVSYDSAKSTERNILRKYYTFEHLSSILRNKFLHLDLRTEILKYFRKCYVDITADEDKTMQYVNVFLYNFNNTEKIKSFNTQLFAFIRSILKRSERLMFKKEIFDILAFELQNYKQLVDINSRLSSESIINYYENAIVIPCKAYLTKMFAIVETSLTGDEFLYIYEMCTWLLELKLEIISNNLQLTSVLLDFDTPHADHTQGVKLNKKYTSLIKTRVQQINETELRSILKKMRSKKFQAFNFKQVYEILDNYLFNLVQRPKSLNLLEEFNTKKENPDLFKKLDRKNEKLFRLNCIYEVYKITKGNFDKSSISNAVSEICIEEERTYGNLLIKYVMFIVSNDIHLPKHFIGYANTILFKMLSYNTSETQNEILSILEDPSRKASYNLEFLDSLALMLFKKMIHLFIASLGHLDTGVKRDYYDALNIIKLFKYMCEEHNNTFQGFLINQMTFYFDNMDKNLSFFDIMLYVVTKVLIISRWEYSSPDKEEDMNIDYLYDLYNAVVELLIEIVQGNKKENLNQIYVELEDKDDINNEKIFKDDGEEEYSINKGEAEAFKKDIADIKTHRQNTKYHQPMRTEHGKSDQSCFQEFMNSIRKMIFHDGSSSGVIYGVRTQLMNFLITLLEEANTDEDLKYYVIDCLNVDKILSSINVSMKKYFIKISDESKEHDQYKCKLFGIQTFHKKSNKRHQMIRFDYYIYQFFMHAYYVQKVMDDSFPNSDEFHFANTYFRFIKIISLQFNHEESIKILIRVKETNLDKVRDIDNNKHSFKSNIVSPINLINDQETYFDDKFLEVFFIVRFFEEITQQVEVQYEHSISTVIFTVIPTIKQLSKESKKEFLHNVDRENQFTKLEQLLDNVDYFCEEIDYNSNRSNNLILRFLRSFNYKYIQRFLFFLALIINLIVLITLQGDTNVYQSHDSAASLYQEIYFEYFNKNATEIVLQHNNNGLTVPDIPHFEDRRVYIKDLIVHSISIWQVYYHFLTVALIILCFFFIVCWFIAKFPLYFRVAKRRFIDENKIKDTNQLTIMDKINIAISYTIVDKDHINSLIWMFIIGILAVTINYGDTIYSFLLLTLLNLDPTLNNIIKAIQLKGKEILLTLITACLIIWAITTIGFFYATEDFKAELDGVEDNFCSNLIWCFLTELDYGTRFRGGIGELMAKVSYERRTGYYIFRWFYNLTYFILIIILMLEMVFGIIVETFRELRIHQTNNEIDKNDICFICGVKRDELEKNKKNFEEHIQKDHNLWNYVNYMIRLKFSDPHDLNAINSYAQSLLEKKNISWVPLAKNKHAAEEELHKEGLEEHTDINDEHSTSTKFLDEHKKI
jgi:hypothetical protein